MDYKAILKLVSEGKLKEHHTAFHRGYVSRKPGAEPKVCEYSGRFGKGYTVETPSRKSTTYDYITYYVEVDE